MIDPNKIFNESLFGDWLLREIEFITATSGNDPESALNLTLMAYKGWLMAPMVSWTAGAAVAEFSIRQAGALAGDIVKAIEKKKSESDD